MEREFAEEFLYHAAKIRREKQKSRENLKKQKKLRKKIAAVEIGEKGLEPSMEKTGIKKPSTAPLPSELRHVPEPPTKLLLGAPKVPYYKKTALATPLPPGRIQAIESHIAEQIMPKDVKIEPIIDLGKLNDLLVDPTVKTIQCDGSYLPIKIVRNNEVINTNIELNEREINDIINKFAEKSEAEITTPVFKTTLKGIIFSAIISEFASPKFIITKK